MRIRPPAGLYLIVLKNDKPISVNAHDPRRAGQCLHVSRLNLKVGMAKDFIARRRSYVRTFGEENIEFIPIVAVDDIATAENVVKDALAQWRVRHTNGRLHEWMVGIERAELQPVILEALARAGIV